MLTFILTTLAVAGHVKSLAVHNQKLEDVTTVHNQKLEDVTAVHNEKLDSIEDMPDEISTLDDLAVMGTQTNVKIIDDEDYNLGGSGDISDNAYDQDGDNAYKDNADDIEYPDEYIDELAEDIIMAEEEDFVESLIKEYEDDQYVTDEDDQYVTEEDDQYVREEDDQYVTEVGREVLKHGGAGGFVNSNLMAGILAAIVSFFITSVMAIFYVTFRVRRMKKELCEEAELYGFLDDTTYNTKVIWKGERKNSSNRWL